jgi:hypothetical protein
MVIDVLERGDLQFPRSLPKFQRLFPDETAFQILHKLRAGMVRPNQDRIGGEPEERVEADETYIGGRTRSNGPSQHGAKGRGVHDMALVAGTVEVKQRSTVAASTSAELDGTPDVFGSRCFQTAAQNRWVASLGASLRQELSLLPMTGVVTRHLKNEGIFMPPLPNVAICKLPRLSAHHSPRALQSKSMATWPSPRRQPATPASLSQRIHIPLQSAFLPIQRFLLPAPCLALLAMSRELSVSNSD